MLASGPRLHAASIDTGAAALLLRLQGRLLASLAFFAIHFMGYYIGDTAILEVHNPCLAPQFCASAPHAWPACAAVFAMPSRCLCGCGASPS